VASLSFRDGPIVTLFASRVTEQKVRAIEVIAEGAYVEADLLNKSVLVPGGDGLRALQLAEAVASEAARKMNSRPNWLTSSVLDGTLSSRRTATLYLGYIYSNYSAAPAGSPDPAAR